ncbi:unnamed protein product [Echinostoma caproni]|uniref:Uncharacterized protein n=1 Tax=Echinostoma caproni TaxID=27848 RepID=A0A183AM85_9TREM|nr:unnamed protein product [Echinostoma caproni]
MQSTPICPDSAATPRRKGRKKSGKDAPLIVAEDSKGSTEGSLPTTNTTAQAHKKGGPPVESLPSAASETSEGWTKMGSAAKRNVSQRNQCFLALNLPEAPTGSGQKRLNHDLLLLRSILEKVFKGEENVANDIKVKAAFRLGKVKDSGPPHPLKVVFGAKTQAEEVFRRSYRLKGYPV